jgi:predicted nucleic acid-binding protein
MNALLDVSFLIACGWQSHPLHRQANHWLASQTSFVTCPLTQLGFLRVSLSPAFRASWKDAHAVLNELVTLSKARFIADDADAQSLPSLVGGNEVTDAYFVTLAKAHHLKLATLDDALCRKPWAVKTASNPLVSGSA